MIVTTAVDCKCWIEFSEHLAAEDKFAGLCPDLPGLADDDPCWQHLPGVRQQDPHRARQWDPDLLCVRGGGGHRHPQGLRGHGECRQQCRCSREILATRLMVSNTNSFITFYASKNMSCLLSFIPCIFWVLSLDRNCIPKSWSNCCLPPWEFPPLANNCDDSYSTSNIRPRLRLFHPRITNIFIPGEDKKIKAYWNMWQLLSILDGGLHSHWRGKTELRFNQNFYQWMQATVHWYLQIIW